MRFEHSVSQHDSGKTETTRLAHEFCELEHMTSESVAVFRHLEEYLADAGFVLANSSEVSQILYNPTLRARSEPFTRVMDMILTQSPITLTRNDANDPNMCIMDSSHGFATAMQEGFSGKDVKNIVKVVISFAPTHLTSEFIMPPAHDLWRTKPQTAEVSRSGNGDIRLEDIRLISFRFPIRYFPSNLLTEEEKERLEDTQINFIVRHYIPTQ